MSGNKSNHDVQDKTQAFLSELTELSMKYGIAITGNPVLFVMEREDYNFPYRIDNESNLSLG
jgi:hypothetical protein